MNLSRPPSSRRQERFRTANPFDQRISSLFGSWESMMTRSSNTGLSATAENTIPFRQQACSRPKNRHEKYNKTSDSRLLHSQIIEHSTHQSVSNLEIRESIPNPVRFSTSTLTTLLLFSSLTVSALFKCNEDQNVFDPEAGKFVVHYTSIRDENSQRGIRLQTGHDQV